MDKIKPIILTDEDTGKKYTLEFTRETVKFAEMRGFSIDDVEKATMTKVPELFYYAFRANHRNLSRADTDNILYNKLHGFPEGMLERLGQLWVAPFECLVQDEEDAKNAKMTVEF